MKMLGKKEDFLNVKNLIFIILISNSYLSWQLLTYCDFCKPFLIFASALFSRNPLVKRQNGTDRISSLKSRFKSTGNVGRGRITLHLESRSVMCNGAEEKQAHRCDPYGLRVQEQPLFLVCSRIVFLLLWIKSHRSKNIYAGADQK